MLYPVRTGVAGLCADVHAVLFRVDRDAAAQYAEHASISRAPVSARFRTQQDPCRIQSGLLQANELGLAAAGLDPQCAKPSVNIAYYRGIQYILYYLGTHPHSLFRVFVLIK